MPRKLLLSAGLVLMLGGCDMAPVSQIDLPTGVTLVETVAQSGDDIVIPYKKYRLDNGLTVVLHEDKSDPIVHVDITYHVGSGREDIGKSGFAHFFEHMMFQGSENVADEAHFKIVTESGGRLNGSTSSDRTNYYQTVPNNQLEKMLWLEADRMGYFLDAVTQDKFEVQRETVKNERGQRIDNQPYGLLSERIGEAQFPEGHPYSWSVIGYMEDLDRATLDDLKKFFLRWYGPNNATLTIGGDIDTQQTLDWVKKYFAPIPEGPAVDKPEYVPVTLDANRYISLEDNVQLPLLYMSWPTVHLNHPDEAPLDVLMNVMGTGQTSLLYKNLEKPGLTVNSGAGHGCRELACSFTLYGLANPQRVESLAALETIMRDTLDEFEARGVEDDDLIRVKADIVSGMIYGLESVSGKVSQLASYETLRNTPNGIGADITRYENVTKDDVMRVYAKYIKNQPAVVMSIVPNGQGELIAKPDTWQRYERTLPESAPKSNVNWSPPIDDFDRSLMPPSGPNPSIKVPDVYEVSLANGIKILGARNTETPTTTISLRIKAAQGHEPLDKLGLAQLTAQMLNEATTENSAEDLSNELDKIGSSVSIFSGNDYSTLRVRSLTKNLNATIAIAAEKLFKPKFDPEDFKRLQARTIEGIKAAKKQPSTVANLAFSKLIYGDKNAFAYANAGTEETVANITLDDVKAFYETYYSPHIASITAVSDISKAKMEKALTPFANWTGGAVADYARAPFPELGTTVVYLIDKPDAAQSEIIIGKRALPYDATGPYYRAQLANYPLGGAFNSRINLNLREDKGYTYGASASFNGSEGRGVFEGSAAVRADVTAEAIAEFVKEFTTYQKDGITPEELAFTKSARGQSEALSYETPRQKLGFLSRMARYDLAPDFVEEQNNILATLTKEDVDDMAAKYYDVQDMIILVVGDKAKVKDKIGALGYPVIEIDADGKRL